MGDFTKIGLGEGKLFKDYGETGETELGYIRGGEFNVNQTIRHIEVDGKKAYVVGDAVTEECLPELSFTMMEMEADKLDVAFFGLTIVDNEDGTATITKSVANPVEADYHTNVAFVGKTKDGTAIIVKLLNALGEGSMNYSFNDKGEIEIPAMFTGNMTSIDDANMPFELTTPYGDSVIA